MTEQEYYRHIVDSVGLRFCDNPGNCGPACPFNPNNSKGAPKCAVSSIEERLAWALAHLDNGLGRMDDAYSDIFKQLRA